MQIFSLLRFVFTISQKCSLKRRAFNFNKVNFLKIVPNPSFVFYLKMNHKIKGHEDFFPMIFSRSVIVSYFLFRSLIHFELIFVGVSRLTFWFFTELPWHNLLKRLSLFIELPLCLHKNLLIVFACVYFGLSFLFYLYMFPLLFFNDQCSFIVSLLSQDMSFPTLFFCISVVLTVLSRCPFHMNLRIIFLHQQSHLLGM